MFSGRRDGFCLVNGPAAELQTLVTTLALRPTSSPLKALREFGESCLMHEGFGVRDTSEEALKRERKLKFSTYLSNRTTRLFEPEQPPAPNAENVRLVKVYVTATRACMVLEYPFG